MATKRDYVNQYVQTMIQVKKCIKQYTEQKRDFKKNFKDNKWLSGEEQKMIDKALSLVDSDTDFENLQTFYDAVKATIGGEEQESVPVDLGE